MTYNTVFAQGCPSPSKAHFNKDKYEALQSNEALPKLPIWEQISMLSCGASRTEVDTTIHCFFSALARCRGGPVDLKSQMWDIQLEV